MNKTKHRKLDRKQQRQQYGENSDLLKALGFNTDVPNLNYTAKIMASQRTVEYMRHKGILGYVKDWVIDYDLYESTVTTQLDPVLLDTGLIVEVGTFGGRTLKQFAYWLPTKTIYGFDSWQGLPEAFNDLPAGHFARDLPKVPANCQLVQGWFGERPPQDQSDIPEFTIQAFADEHPEPIALLHLDADLYSSTKTVLDVFAKQIVPGTVILFNEYWNHSTWEDHEYKAWQEHCKMHGIKYEYIGYASDHQEVAVRVL